MESVGAAYLIILLFRARCFRHYTRNRVRTDRPSNQSVAPASSSALRHHDVALPFQAERLLGNRSATGRAHEACTNEREFCIMIFLCPNSNSSE
ncbi:hypothetical protein EDB85DRAFT_2001226 [Lactarius pseudohatsudake]|nr:hypothetical protein EDB85DRAFT_2001226 [Lactarius pseudohatsudake]